MPIDRIAARLRHHSHEVGSADQPHMTGTYDRGNGCVLGRFREPSPRRVPHADASNAEIPFLSDTVTSDTSSPIRSAVCAGLNDRR